MSESTPFTPAVTAPPSGAPPDGGVDTSPPRWHRALCLLGGVSVALLVCAFALRHLSSVDFWWQLRLGQYITELREVPRTDPFTLTAQGRPYIDSHWLFQVVQWWVYRAAGINGVQLGVAAVGLLTLLCVWLAAARREGYGLSLLAVALAAGAAGERFIPRPDLISLLCLAVTVLVVTRFRATGSRWVWALPVLHLLWVNSHGLWILGPIVVGAFLVGDTVLPRLPLPAAWRAHAMPASRLRILALVFAAMCALTFVTPQPWAQATYPFTLFREIQGAGDWVATSVTELAAPLSDPHWPVGTWAFVGLGAFTVAGFGANWRRIDLVALGLCAAFAYLALTARRNMAVFAVLTAPLAAEQWAQAVAGWSRGRRLRVQACVAGLTVVLATGVAWGVATNRFARRDGDLTRFGLGLSPAHHPGRLGDFISAARVPGPIWNTPGLGGYLSWRFWPEREVFIDGRWEIYGQPFLEAYSRSVRDPAAWDRMAEQYAIQSAALFHRRPDLVPLLQHLSASPEWALCYADAVAVLFVRRSATTADWVRTHEVRLTDTELPSPLPADPVVIWLDAYRTRPRFTGLAAWLQTWPPRAADGTEAALIGNLCFVLEADAAAATWFARALAVEPENHAAHLSLGFLAEQRRDAASAVTHYAAAAAARPWESEAWIRYAQAALATGDVHAARTAFQQARRRAPADPRVRALARALDRVQ